MSPVEITGDGLVLREFSRADLGGLHGVYGDEKTVTHLSFSARSKDGCLTIIDRAMEDAKADPRRVYLLAVTRGDRVVGVARLAREEYPHSASLGFALRADHWGRGLGTELVSLLLKFGFRDLGLYRLWGARAPENMASARVMERVGMREEGRIRAHVWTGEAWRDSISHSILRDEWERAAR
ncbi:Protein N-acetyltransferase, RimJ/RimL family [Marinactinospora thermotolerans DSM 45154]|uniref:Protein N-acetyltransferase, RimJ/RimL family n=1 Tax=Marinactinospora thermotolerans DSM 45154 TaxID=1122192 RepID=A0A1T4TES8_9ACTN|nr:GNAT family N-acetyltransferase [Marinactinospora thermotolerans]SKA39005.1 Protein N-acetyltransferase, RimJ/RimL family [Marinactinospora thermotolerans DSM 45154]